MMAINCRTTRRAAIVAMFTSAGILLGSSGLACASFGLETAMSSVDFCFLLDCQNGAFGGLIDPCGQGGLVLNGETFANGTVRPVLVDCPAQ